MFAEVIDLFDQYCDSFKNQPGELHPHLAAEVKERLKQLNLIIVRVRELQHRDSARHQKIQTAFGQHAMAMIAAGIEAEQPVPDNLAQKFNEHISEWAEVCVELRLLTEAFYYFGARIRKILREQPMPGLEKFECVGVRNVRNHLIEHPEGKSSQVFYQSFGYGDPQGPVLKGGRPSDQGRDFQDVGLYVNAEEFRINLTRALNAALARA